MYLDPRACEYLLKLRPGLSKKQFRKPIEFVDNSVSLRLVDVRTYGGLTRFALDGEGKSVVTGATTVPMRIRDPFRLTENGAYILYFHLSLRDDLPTVPHKHCVAEIIPTEEFADAGILFTRKLIKQGDLFVSVFTLRQMQMYIGYPLALVRFMEEEVLTVEKAVKGNGKNTSSRAE